jgi:large subunit ribosomal protein L46
MLPRSPASLHLRSLQWARTFSSSSSPSPSAVAAGADGKIVASVVFERLPVVIPKINPVVYAFQEFSYRQIQPASRPVNTTLRRSFV